MSLHLNSVSVVFPLLLLLLLLPSIDIVICFSCLRVSDDVTSYLQLKSILSSIFFTPTSSLPSLSLPSNSMSLLYYFLSASHLLSITSHLISSYLSRHSLERRKQWKTTGKRGQCYGNRGRLSFTPNVTRDQVSFSVETFLKVTGMKMKRRKVGGGRVLLW